MDLDNFEPVARIVVIGIGGAGNNAVNRMMDENIENVEFYVLNTDKQALATSKAPNRIVIGEEVTSGLGAGGNPEVGEKAAEASKEEIRNIVRGANMVFIAAGMGGGTGTGASPIVARIAREEGALTIAIVTRPFNFEGKQRIANSVSGLNNLKDAVDSIIIVSNDKLLVTSGHMPIAQSFAESDKVLAQSVRTVTDLILFPAVINLDFADVKSTLKGAGIALIGFGTGEGPDKARQAAENAIASPLLEASISGARRAICAVTCGSNVSLYEAEECVNRIIEQAGSGIDVKFGVSLNANLGDRLLVSVIASDFTQEFDFTYVPTFEALHSPLGGRTAPQNNESLLTPSIEPEKEEAEEESDFGESVLPDFLTKDIFGEGED